MANPSAKYSKLPLDTDSPRFSTSSDNSTIIYSTNEFESDSSDSVYKKSVVVSDGRPIPTQHREANSTDRFSIDVPEFHRGAGIPSGRRGLFNKFWFAYFRVKSALLDWYDANLGLMLFASGQLFSSTMNLFTRILEIDTNPPFHALQIVFARMSITAVICTAVLIYQKVPYAPLGPPEVRWLLVLRGFTGFFGLYGVYYSLAYLSLSETTVISFLTPTVAGFACSIFLKEPFGKVELFAGLLSFCGVILIAQPGGEVSSGDDNERHVTVIQRWLAVGVSLLGVVGASGAFTAIRCIGNRAHPLMSVNYFAVMCTIVSFVMLTFSPSLSFVWPRTAWQWFLLIFIGVCGFCFQFLLTAGLQREKAGRAGNMLYLQMFFAIFFEKMVWNKVPDANDIAGSTIILGSAIWVAISKQRAAEQAKLTSVIVSSSSSDENMEMHDLTRQ
ncbi:uncharacterized protein V1518DRAFT_408081 [Limtongia smithiae]|uniref:uncharacterized protein n=1 Tax=Limtongia smithiae TaxID=1125753 RepID=UPI0034CDDCEC